MTDPLDLELSRFLAEPDEADEPEIADLHVALVDPVMAQIREMRDRLDRVHADLAECRDAIAKALDGPRARQ